MEGSSGSSVKIKLYFFTFWLFLYIVESRFYMFSVNFNSLYVPLFILEILQSHLLHSGFHISLCHSVWKWMTDMWTNGIILLLINYGLFNLFGIYYRLNTQSFILPVYWFSLSFPKFMCTQRILFLQLLHQEVILEFLVLRYCKFHKIH